MKDIDSKEIDKMWDKSHKVFMHLRETIDEWKDFVEQKYFIQEAKGMLFPIGSLALGVLDAQSDIDGVVVASPDFSRDDHFFGELVWMLENNSKVTEVSVLDKAYVPIIKLKYDDGPIDLQFANYHDIDDLGIFEQFPKNIKDK